MTPEQHLILLVARIVERMQAKTGGTRAAEPLHDAIHRVEREIAEEREPMR
jgi:hypothetical protein